MSVVLKSKHVPVKIHQYIVVVSGENSDGKYVHLMSSIGFALLSFIILSLCITLWELDTVRRHQALLSHAA